jgi:hypothetical protein
MNTKRVSVSAWLRSGMTITLMLLMALALKAEVSITVTGTLAGGRDYLGIFGMGQAMPAGTPFKLVYSVDDTKGQKLWQQGCPNGGSGILGGGPYSPAKAVLTINGKSHEFGVRPDSRSSVWRSVPTRCSNSEIGMDITEGKWPIVSGVRIKLLPKQNRPLTTNGDWRGQLTLSEFYAPSMGNEFAITTPANNYTITSSHFLVSSVTVH